MKTLADYYTFLEDQNVHDHHHISSQLKKLQDETVDDLERDKIAAEIFAMDFMLREGGIRGIIESLDADGHTLSQYPDPKTYTKQIGDYMRERINKSNNFSARARYAQVIANCDNGAEAGKAIQDLVDNSFGFIGDQIARPFEDGDRCYMIRSAFENLYPHAIKSGYKVKEANELLSKLVFTDDILSPTFRVSMIEYLFEQRKQFEKQTLKDALTLCDHIYSKGDGTEMRVMEDLYSVALSLTKSGGGDLKLWHARMAEAYENEISVEGDAGGMAAMEDCKKAIEKYRLAKNDVKVKELTIRYTELRKNLKFSKIETNLDAKKLNDHFNKIKARLKKLYKDYSADEIMHFLINESKLFPSEDILKKKVQARKPGIQDFVRLMKADINKNFQLEINTKEERELNKLYEEYHFDMQLFMSHQLRLIFYYGYTYQRVTFQTMITYLQKWTWIGATLSRIDSGGDVHEYNWLSMLGPALHELFNQMEATFKAPKRHLNLVMVMDSLTLKFEGLLRDFALLNGAQTIVHAKDVIREMFIEELLGTEEIQKLFSEDDRLLFRYVFVSKYGLNLRNQVAHSFMLPHHYTFDKVLLVLMAILRLGKYEINAKEPVS